MKKKSNTRMIITTFCVILFINLSICQNQQQTNTTDTQAQSTSQNPQTVPLPSINQQLYTENIQQFKSKKYNQRLETLVGCWLMSKQYIDVHKSNYLFFQDLKLKQAVTLKLVKQCMKRIKRKQAVLKITQLVGKNIQPAKKYEDIIPKSTIDNIFNQVSKLTIANYHHYKPINEDLINGQVQNQNNNNNETNYIQNNNNNETNNSQKLQIITQTQNIIQKQQTLQQTSQNIFGTMSQFDIFLIDLIKKYNQQFHKLTNSKQGLRGRVQQQLKKKQKYYFGFIPASSFSHSVFLVTISLSMVFCCTCYKYYKMRSNQNAQRKIKNTEENQENCKSHSHNHLKQCKKLTKMAQMTMKKKVK